MQRACKLTVIAMAASLLVVTGCPIIPPASTDDGPIAEGVSAALGDVIPTSTAEQMATFERGKAVMNDRFAPSDGLGPAFNITFCGGCHEKPTPGGAAGLYRSFNLAGTLTGDGAFIPAPSSGAAGGVVRLIDLADGNPTRPPVAATTNVFAQRNPIPFFGTGLIAELPESAILANADPDDEDGDGISGRVNIDRGFVGRFGRKAQTVSIEGFIRGPLFNHLGITTEPLSDAQRAALPVDSSLAGDAATGKGLAGFAADAKLGPHMQAAAPDGPNFDDDGVPDPEMSSQDLFDLVSFSMLLAAPEFDELSEQGEQGRQLFHQANCSACHVPRLEGPRGNLPLYSDLLLHDMGPDLADGIVQGLAFGSEFRTQPLWGISAVGPYLHDGRAMTLESAILAHGGEAEASRDAFAAFSAAEKAAVEEFLLSLGGRSQMSGGLVPPDATMAGPGEYGGPLRALTDAEADRYEAGLRLFDHEFGYEDGIGGLTGAVGDARFNGDSCRACHFDPVIGGSGPLGLNVTRHGRMDGGGAFTAPGSTANTILHRLATVGELAVDAEDGTNVFELRQTPHVFGAGLVEAISDATLLANADPDDLDGDGISGRPNVLSDGRIGRFGWKADVPSVGEFIRDAMGAELGLTVEAQPGLTFGITSDGDGVADPELSSAEAEDLGFFLRLLGPPPRSLDGLDAADVVAGEMLFESVGCAKCHIPSLGSGLGEAALYSDLLLHEILPEGSSGVTSADASVREFRTAPLWGVSKTAPYFHDGSAETLDDAIRSHAGEADAVRTAYEGLSEFERNQLLTFLSSL